jgi:5-methylcytosine-specific restriction endonuclease McrA
MNGRVLVLNASFEPINVCTERRAVVMLFKGVARTEEHNGHMLHSEKLAMNAPSVIRLTEYVHVPFERRSLSRKNILLRDHNTCQYCGENLPPSELTLDHVIPRSRGGASAWDNLVACCKRCNHRKGSKTPEEARMVLQRRPRAFSLHVSRQIIRYLGRADTSWRKYLFYENDAGEQRSI